MKPLPVAFRQQALDDLEQISDCISKDNPQAANRVVQRIHHVIFIDVIAIFHAARDPATKPRP